MDIFFILTLILSPSVYSFAIHPNNTNNSIRSRRHDKKSLNVIHQMSATTSESDIAIIGCGVLGTSLCKQLLTSPDFQGRSGTCIVQRLTS